MTKEDIVLFRQIIVTLADIHVKQTHGEQGSVVLLVDFLQATVKTKEWRGLPCRHRGGQRNERPSAIVFPKRSNAFNPIIRLVGEGSTLATGYTSGVRNGKGPLSRTVEPCEPSTFVKDKGWSQKRGRTKKKPFPRLLHVQALSAQCTVLKARQ